MKLDIRTIRALIIAVILILGLAACGPSSTNASTMAELPEYDAPMPGAMYGGEIDYGESVALRGATVHHDGESANVITGHIVYDPAATGSPFFLAENQIEKVFPYWIQHIGDKLIVWLIPTCDQYSFTDNGGQKTLQMFEGETYSDINEDPYGLIKAVCTGGKIAILDIAASPDCRQETIVWEESGRWSCTAQNGSAMWIDPPPDSQWMWPQGLPQDGG